ncbi:MAG: hypothetical protein ACEQSR_10015 [Candidatus Methylacidiphilales bacterium]
MKKTITLLTSIIATAIIASCGKETVEKTTTTAGTTTTTKSPLDYEIDYSVKVNYSVMVISGNYFSVATGKTNSSSLEGAKVTITQGDKTIQSTTNIQGIASFSGVYKGLIAVSIVKDEYTSLNYLVTVNGSVTEVNGKQIDIANMVPIFKVKNDIATAILSGKVSYQNDLTNLNKENVPANTIVTATIDASDAAFKTNYINVPNTGILASLNSGKIVQFAYEGFFYDSTDNNGNYSIPVPAGIAGLPIKINSSDIVSDQKVFENTGVSGFNRTTSYRTIFSPDQIPTPVPNAGGAEVLFLTGSGATAFATISGNGQIDRINITSGGTGYVAPPKITITGGGGTGATAAATINNGVITSINIINGGTGYSSEPTISISSGSGASVTATVGGGGSVVSIALINSGNGYTSTPNITISAPSLPGGTTATATANVSGGRITSVTLTNGGSGYTTAPSITIDPAPSGGINATASAAFSGFSVQSVTLTNPGFGYTGAPTVTFSDPSLSTGTKATGSAIFDPATGSVIGISISNPGSGYFSAPSVTLSSGSGASGQAVFSGRSITGFTITNAGANYTTAPKVKITGGGGTGAAATAIVNNGRLIGLTITNPGQGYTSAPTIELIAGGGAQASIVISNGQVSAINIVNGGSQYTGAPTVVINPIPLNGPGGGATATVNIDANGSLTSVTITNPGSGYIGGNIPSIAEPFSLNPSAVDNKINVKPGLNYIRDIYYGTGKKLPQ